MKEYDIVVIGGGPGGAAAVKRAVQLGAKALLIEKEYLGGVCLNWGCIPTKALLASAKNIEAIKRASEFGVSAELQSVDLEKIVKRKDDLVTMLRESVGAGYTRAKIDVLFGHARLKDKETVVVSLNDGGEEEIRTKKIILAMGSTSKSLPFLPFDNKTVFDSKGIMNLKSLPASLVIIGGGAIGCEFACFFNALGVAVTIIEMQKHLLPIEDPELGKRLALTMKKKGITVLVDEGITSASVIDTGVALETQKGQSLTFAAALVGVGRSRPVTDCGLDTVDIVYEGDAVVVDDYFETATPGIYAIGDLISSPLLAHVAIYEGRVAAENAVFGNTKKRVYDVVPGCVFSSPEIASVGLTKDTAAEQGIPVAVAKELFTASGKAHCEGEAEGFIKLVYRTDTQEVVGGQIMGPHASELIGEIALAVKAKITVAALADTIHQHPTLYESIQDAATSAMHALAKQCGV